MHSSTIHLMQQNLQHLLSTMVSNLSEKPSETTVESIKSVLQRNWAFNFYLAPKILEYAKWLEYSDEVSNFTYELNNIHHLKGWLACVTGADIGVCDRMVEEIIYDDFLIDLIINTSKKKEKFATVERFRRHSASLYGRRIGWYCVVRIKKPAMVIETGVDRGLGSAIICRALMRNAEEGKKGNYLGTDIDPSAGYLLTGPLSEFGQIAYGDSIATLNDISNDVDVFINDSDHSADYEEREYGAIAPHLTRNSIILGDNSHVTDKLYQFALQTDRRFLHFAESPANHWYPGAGIGAAF
jgi:hypothetical protein